MPAGVAAGYVVVRRGKVVLRYRERAVFRSASVVKLLIALDHLRSGKRDVRLLEPMLRSSDDRAATELWRRGGRGEIIQRMVRLVGLRETAPPPADKPGFWGYTALSAGDVARVYQHLMRVPEGKVVLGYLRKSTRCGADGFDQSFGIPRLGRDAAVKQGWSGFGDVPAVRCRGNAVRVAAPLGIGRPVLHTTGVVGDRIVVVLTLQPAGSGFEAGAKRVTALTRQVYAAS